MRSMQRGSRHLGRFVRFGAAEYRSIRILALTRVGAASATLVHCIRISSQACLVACAFASSAPAKKATGAVVSISPTTTLRLVIEVEAVCAMVTFLVVR
jgi:hypothetical protein